MYKQSLVLLILASSFLFGSGAGFESRWGRRGNRGNRGRERERENNNKMKNGEDDVARRKKEEEVGCVFSTGYKKAPPTPPPSQSRRSSSNSQFPPLSLFFLHLSLFCCCVCVYILVSHPSLSYRYCSLSFSIYYTIYCISTFRRYRLAPTTPLSYSAERYIYCRRSLLVVDNKPHYYYTSPQFFLKIYSTEEELESEDLIHSKISYK